MILLHISAVPACGKIPTGICFLYFLLTHPVCRWNLVCMHAQWGRKAYRPISAGKDQTQNEYFKIHFKNSFVI